MHAARWRWLAGGRQGLLLVREGTTEGHTGLGSARSAESGWGPSAT